MSSCSRCWPRGPRTGRRTRPQCATRSRPRRRPRARRSSRWRPDRDPLVGRDRELATMRGRAGDRPPGIASVVAVGGAARGSAKPAWSTRPPPRPDKQGAAVVRGRAGEEFRAYGPWRGCAAPAGRELRAGCRWQVLDDVRRVAGDGRAPGAPASDAAAPPATGRRRGCGCSTRCAELVARGGARSRPLHRARGRPCRRPVVAAAARAPRPGGAGCAHAGGADLPRRGDRPRGIPSAPRSRAWSATGG